MVLLTYIVEQEEDLVIVLLGCAPSTEKLVEELLRFRDEIRHTSAKVQIDYRVCYAHKRTHAAHRELPVDPCATRNLYSSIVNS